MVCHWPDMTLHLLSVHGHCESAHRNEGMPVFIHRLKSDRTGKQLVEKDLRVLMDNEAQNSNAPSW